MNARSIHRLGAVWLMAAGLSVFPSFAFAQADTAQARQVFADVNKQLPQLDAVRFTSKRPAADYRAEGRAWAEAGVIKKIEITERDDSGDVVSEFYYAGAALVFVYESVKGFADSGNSRKMVTRLEERYYFRDGKLFKWISGMGNDKGDNAPGTADFVDAGKSRLQASDTFLAAARKAYSAKTSGK